MSNEKTDKRKKPTRRVLCPDCGTTYAVTAFKLHRCAAHDRQQWVKVEGNEQRYQEVLKGTVELDMSAEEQIKQGSQTIDATVGKTLDQQVSDQQHITKHQLEDKPMSDNESDNKDNDKSKAHEYEYECGECHHQFDGKPKHCPGCDIELQW